MKIVLIYPPDRRYPSLPYASLPALASTPKKNGHEVVLRDINLEVFHALADEDKLLPYYDLYTEKMATLGNKKSLNPSEADEYCRLTSLLALPRESLTSLSRAKEVMLNRKDFYNPELFNKAWDDLRCAQRFYFGENPLDSSEIPDLVGKAMELMDKGFNDPIADLYRENLIDNLLDEKPDLIGFSIPFMVSYYESLKLIKLIRDRAPDIPLVIGGALVDSHKEIMAADPRLYSLFDYASVGDGEVTLTSLASALEKGEDIKTVPNIYFMNGKGMVEFTFTKSVDNLNDLPTPDFSALPLEKYLTPERVASFQTSRGCYYGKCTFCSESFRENFRLRKPELVVEDMVEINKTAGVDFFLMWDSLCPPKTLKHVAQQVKERDLDFTWFAETKMEKIYLEPNFMNNLYEGGCRFLQFGFESASQRVLELIDKDNDLPEVDIILDNIKNAGIQSGLFWFIGFPTETEDEAKLTFDYVEQRRHKVALSGYTGTYNLLPDQPLFYDQENYGINIFRNQWGGYEFNYKDGSRPYDCAELHHTYTVRSDLELAKHGAYLLYGKHDPEAFKKLTGVYRAGPLSRHIEDMRTVLIQKPDEACLKEFPRDTIKDYNTPPQPFKLAYQKMTGEVFRLRGKEVAALEAASEPVEAQSLMSKLGIDWPELETILHRLTNRGLLKFITDETHNPLDESELMAVGMDQGR